METIIAYEAQVSDPERVLSWWAACDGKLLWKLSLLIETQLSDLE